MTGDATGGFERLEATIHGAVQGVGFRWFVAREARALGLTGWTANRADGTVEVVAEGPRDALRSLAMALRDGPPQARVTDVVERTGPARGGSTRFEIRAGAHAGD